MHGSSSSAGSESTAQKLPISAPDLFLDSLRFTKNCVPAYAQICCYQHKTSQPVGEDSTGTTRTLLPLGFGKNFRKTGKHISTAASKAEECIGSFPTQGKVSRTLPRSHTTAFEL
jgi:hypothetical protein